MLSVLYNLFSKVLKRQNESGQQRRWKQLKSVWWISFIWLRSLENKTVRGASLLPEQESSRSRRWWADGRDVYRLSWDPGEWDREHHTTAMPTAPTERETGRSTEDAWRRNSSNSQFSNRHTNVSMRSKDAYWAMGAVNRHINWITYSSSSSRLQTQTCKI